MNDRVAKMINPLGKPRGFLVWNCENNYRNYIFVHQELILNHQFVALGIAKTKSFVKTVKV